MINIYNLNTFDDEETDTPEPNQPDNEPEEKLEKNPGENI